MNRHRSIIIAMTLLLGGAPLAMGQSGSPPPNVPKESGLPSKESDTHDKQGPKGLSGERPTTKGKDSTTRQQEQMKHKESGKQAFEQSRAEFIESTVIGIQITVWSDYVCPFCYLEEPVLSRIRCEYGTALDLQWRAFELRPTPVPTLDPNGEYLHTVWDQSVYPMAKERGMTIRLPPVQPRSRRAFELAELARAHGRFDQVHRGIFKAFFEDGRNIEALETLIIIGTAAGLDGDAVRAALDGGTYRTRVLHDEREAAELGIAAVPTMRVARTDRPLREAQVLTGAQSYGAVKAAVEHARLGPNISD